MKRSGWILALAGFVAILFFVLTDPRLGPAGHPHESGPLDWRHWLFSLRASPANIIDAGHEALLGTLLGVVGSLAVLGIGVWLATRKIDLVTPIRR